MGEAFKKINSSSNAHFLGGNSHHLLSSNDLLHLHAASLSPSAFRRDVTLPGLQLRKPRLRGEVYPGEGRKSS